MLICCVTALLFGGKSGKRGLAQCFSYIVVWTKMDGTAWLEVCYLLSTSARISPKSPHAVRCVILCVYIYIYIHIHSLSLICQIVTFLQHCCVAGGASSLDLPIRGAAQLQPHHITALHQAGKQRSTPCRSTSKTLVPLQHVAQLQLNPMASGVAVADLALYLKSLLGHLC